MLKTNYMEFVNEQCKLTIVDSMDDFDVKDVEWELELNVSDIWNKFQKDRNTNEFLKSYKDRLLSKKNNLIGLNRNCWTDLVKLIKEKDENFLPYLDKIYDWADKYGVKINSSEK